MSNFIWQWENSDPQPDPAMTRETAARLLKAWRGNSREFHLRRIASGTYSVRHVPSNTSATMIIERGRLWTT